MSASVTQDGSEVGLPAELSKPACRSCKMRRTRPDYIEYASQDPNKVQQCMGSGILGWVGLAVPAQARRDDMIASRGQGRKLVPPRVPQLGEAVTEEHEGAGSLLGNMH